MLSSKPGDIVFDPFAGSGTSRVDAQMCERDWIGCEIDHEMWNKASNWMNNYNKELAKEYIEHRIR